ncbi:hypothetical protein PTTG_29852, partial [Puccinia triticina 1-1 BBBD Race 1]
EDLSNSTVSNSPYTPTAEPSLKQEDDTPLASSGLSFKSVKSESDSDDQIQFNLLSEYKSSDPTFFFNMSTSNTSSIKLVTKKLDRDNFSSWRWAIVTTLGYKGLDDYILLDQTDEMKKKPKYHSQNKMATNFIQMHLSTDNLERFVSDLRDYDAKKLWDAIEAHFVAKTKENAADAMDKYFDIHFDENDMDKSILNIRHAYRHLCEVGAAKFGKAGLTTMAVVFALRKLPSSYSTFRTLQFKEFKEDKTEELKDMESFLSALESEVRRECESQQQLISAASALAVSQNQNAPDSSRRKGRRVQCTGGKHHPEATHPESKCFHLHKDKAIAHHQAAIKRLTKSSHQASLGSKTHFCDAIILDSGALGHFLKEKSYFSKLSSSSSSVFGANGAAIPILGFSPATIQTAIGPLHISLALLSGPYRQCQP